MLLDNERGRSKRLSFYFGILPVLVTILFVTLFYLSPKVKSILTNLKEEQFEYMKANVEFNFQRFVEWHNIIHRLERREGGQKTSLRVSFWSSTVGAIIAALLILVSCFGNVLPPQADFWCKAAVGFCLLFAVVSVITPANLVMRHELASDEGKSDIGSSRK